MADIAYASMLILAQLVGLGGGGLPQVMEPRYSEDIVAAGESGEVVVSFAVVDGYAINRVPAIRLELEDVEGLTHNAAKLVSPADDPKSTDDYYVDVPSFRVQVSVAAAGEYEIPGELIYFFCSKADGFCSRQIIDVVVPVAAR